MDQPKIVQAAKWISRYSQWYGADTINRFRQGDQSLPGKTFPLLPVNDDEMIGRYALLMDGQWRVRDIDAFVARRRQQGIDCPEFGVCPLPCPDGGRKDAGWVNGNFFVIPRGAKNSAGAVALMRFWIGLDNPDQAAKTCAAGGWIPVSQRVVETRLFQEYLDRQPLFRQFVHLAGSQDQYPVPVIPGAPMFKREVEKAAASALADPDQSIDELMHRTRDLIQNRLDRIRGE